MVKILIDIPAELHDRLRHDAIKKHLGLYAYMIQLLKLHVGK